MSLPIVTVFGGTGFLGRRIVRRLRDHEFAIRVASRHPDQGQRLFGPEDPQIAFTAVDVQSDQAVAAALEGAYAAVNAVSLYVERGGATYQAIHVAAARRVAAEARRIGLARFAHVSGIGSDPASPSRYIRKRGEGELAVQDAMPEALIIRPSVMFGPDDAFLSTILKLVRRLPIIPLFGRGDTRLQPVSVEDVAEGIARALQRTELQALTLECAGPHVYRYRELLGVVGRAVGRRPLLMPTSFAAWRALAQVCERLPSPPVTTNQIELMQVDNVASPDALGFAALGIAPQPVEVVLQGMLRSSAGPDHGRGI